MQTFSHETACALLRFYIAFYKGFLLSKIRSVENILHGAVNPMHCTLFVVMNFHAPILSRKLLQFQPSFKSKENVFMLCLRASRPTPGTENCSRRLMSFLEYFAFALLTRGFKSCQIVLCVPAFSFFQMPATV